MSETMNALLSSLSTQAKAFAANADAASRKYLLESLRDVQFSLESPEETMQRLIYANLTIASIRVSLDLKIFDKLAASEEPLTVMQLAEDPKADPVLLARLLRHQASLGYIKETDQDTFTAGNVTRNLAVPEIQAGLYFCNDVLGPAFQALPEFLAEKNYQNPESLVDTPFHKAWKTDVPLWEWLHERPKETAYFNRFMYAQRSSVQDCFSFLALDQETKDWPQEKAVFVDIGGGTGQQCVALRKKCPNIRGKVILQDLPTVIAQAQVSSDIETLAYDFFTPQPIKGAKFYYLRAIMHDHADQECLQILKNIAEAMTEESTLLLDEIVTPDRDVEWSVTQTDLAMLVQFSSMERTETQWRKLLQEAGLKVQTITTYTYSFKLSIVAATKQ